MTERRSRLLPQPGGFEGLLRLSKGPEVDRSSLTKLEHPPGRVFRFDPALSASVMNATDQHRDFANPDYASISARPISQASVRSLMYWRVPSCPR